MVVSVLGGTNSIPQRQVRILHQLHIIQVDTSWNQLSQIASAISSRLAHGLQCCRLARDTLGDRIWQKPRLCTYTDPTPAIPTSEASKVQRHASRWRRCPI